MILAYMRSPPGAGEVFVAVLQNLALPLLLFSGIDRLNRVWGDRPGRLAAAASSLGLALVLAQRHHLIPLFLISAVLILFGMRQGLLNPTGRTHRSPWPFLVAFAILGVLSVVALGWVESSARGHPGLGVPDFEATGIGGVLLWSAAVCLFFGGPLLSPLHRGVTLTGFRALVMANCPFFLLAPLVAVVLFSFQQTSSAWNVAGAILLPTVVLLPIAAWYGWVFSAISACSFAKTKPAWSVAHSLLAVAYLTLQFFFFWSTTDYWSPFGAH